MKDETQKGKQAKCVNKAGKYFQIIVKLKKRWSYKWWSNLQYSLASAGMECHMMNILSDKLSQLSVVSFISVIRIFSRRVACLFSVYTVCLERVCVSRVSYFLDMAYVILRAIDTAAQQPYMKCISIYVFVKCICIYACNNCERQFQFLKQRLIQSVSRLGNTIQLPPPFPLLYYPY